MREADRPADNFIAFFKTATGGLTPYDWQIQVAHDGLPDVLTVPSGLGKTEVALAWAWRLLVEQQPEPLHLVICLPMRTLVAQTVQRLTSYFEALRVAEQLNVRVHQLMGGAIDKEWARRPSSPWILVGTQDQLLSRALNRGFAMSRFQWPVHFGLLNNDCRWLIDEVQLMGPGLWTTSQLDWMRRKRFPSLKPCLTTWMSATVGTSFLSTTDRIRDGLGAPAPEQAEFDAKLKFSLDTDQGLSWWRTATRPIEWWKPEKPSKTATAKKSPKMKSPTETIVTAEGIAHAVVKEHTLGTLSLVICNTVEKARAVFRALPVEHKVLLTSQFRREDRRQHERRLLEFDAARKTSRLTTDDPGLICVSTQVIEAGTDISAHRLWSELAPWPSMLQRLGRLNRKGDDPDARALVWETPKEMVRGTDDRIGPYARREIVGAKKLVDVFATLSQEKSFTEAIAQLNTQCESDVLEALQPEASPLPRALDVHGLFSTERDLHGGFTDISPFVRSTDPDVDVTVFWRDWPDESPPRGDELDGPLLEPATEGCPVSVVHLRKMLETSKGRAWLWNDEADRWEPAYHQDIYPGMLVMLKRNVGGYDTTDGWTGDKANTLSDVPRAGRGATLRVDSLTEVGYWSRLEVHLADARGEAEQICDELGFRDGRELCAICKVLRFSHVEDRCQLRAAIVKGSALHDIGKAHPQWQSALPDRSGIPNALLAKTPRVLAIDVVDDADSVRQMVPQLRPGALLLPDESRRRRRENVVRLRWSIDNKLGADELKSLRALSGVRWAGHVPFRPGLRHEVASALAMWWKYRNGDADYPALATYLVATHHGKVRTVLRSTTGEGGDVFGVKPEPSALALASDQWPLDFSVAKDGAEGRWEGDAFVLTGHGWTGLVADLLGPWRPEENSDVGVVPKSEPRHLGPFVLAYLEALVRVADWLASETPSAIVKPSEVRRDG